MSTAACARSDAAVVVRRASRRYARAALAALILALGSGAPAAETLEAQGRRLYREGVLPSGRPLAAIVAGDVPVQGGQLTCLGCHQRSGMGSSEGTANVPPIAGPFLFAPGDGPRRRPAYTDETFARAIRDGVDPAGHPLDPLMPRYRLDDADVRALVAFLRTLSAETAPGVTGETIRFATVVADDAPPAARDAMLEVLDRFFAEKNGETRQEPRRAQVLSTRSANRGYRRWLLSRWTLHGPPAGWSAQLEEQYRAEPVFGLLSGIAAGDWRPVHDFCERNEIPCLLPNTDLPAAGGEDYYTVYFSRGIVLEAEVLATQLSTAPSRGRVLQASRPGSAGERAAHGLRRVLDGRPGVTLTDLSVPPGEPVAADLLARRVAGSGATSVVLWLGPDDIAALGASGWSPGEATVYLSSTLLGQRLDVIPRALRAHARVVHPFLLPNERAGALGRLRAWLTKRGGGVTDERIQAQTYFACLVAGDGLMHVRWLLYRDYFLDTLDHAGGLASFPSYYPRLSFGPRQRYLAKGAYVLRLGGDGSDPLVTEATWVGVGG